MTPSEIAEYLAPLTPFYYWPNEGNIGDLLIAEATRQFFFCHGLEFQEYNPALPPQEESYNLVYGGGGRFTSHWGKLEWFLKHLTASHVKHCVILPHSLFDADTFVKSLDARHTVFCRESRSYDYCRSLNASLTVILGDDMGLQLKLNELSPCRPSAYLESENDEEWQRLKNLLRYGISQRMNKGVHDSLVSAKVNGKKSKLAILLRKDKERSTKLHSPLSYDISLAIGCVSCRTSPYNSELIRAFAQALNQADSVMTDRLHVAIMAYHLGKEIFLLDNDYHKLSGVYKQSLVDAPTIHLIGNNLPSELRVAWCKLNAPHRFIVYAWEQCSEYLRPLNMRLKGKICHEWNRVRGRLFGSGKVR